MNQWVGLIVGITAILAFMGTGTVFVLSGRQKVRIANLETTAHDLREDVGDRDRRIEFLEHENAVKDEHIAVQDARIADLEQHVAVLERLKLGEAYFEKLAAQMEAHSAKVLANHDKIMDVANIIRNQNRDMLALLADQRRHRD